MHDDVWHYILSRMTKWNTVSCWHLSDHSTSEPTSMRWK